MNSFIPFKEIKYMSCASIGVLNGYAYATENLDHAEQLWKSICNNDTRLVINQILRSSMLQQNITNLYAPEKTLLPYFYCALLDFSHRNIVYKNLSSVDKNQIPLYLKASVAMPVYNHSVQLDDTAYFDGAMIDNIPIYPLLKHNLDYIICIYFDDTYYKFENTYFDNKIIKITFPCESALKQSVIFWQDSIEDMIRKGYDRTMYLLKSVFSEGYENLDYIYRTIDYMNQNNKNSSNKNCLRITGDVLVTNLNKVTQKFINKKIV